jgi:hypothetical protein
MKIDPNIRAGNWAIADDGHQWIVRQRRGDQWQAVSFVRSTKEVLARCLHEAGATSAEVIALLDPLPDRHKTCPDGYGVRFSARSGRPCVSRKINAAIPRVITGPVESYSAWSLRAAGLPLDPETAALNRQLNDWDRIKRETAWGRKSQAPVQSGSMPSVGSPVCHRTTQLCPIYQSPTFCGVSRSRQQRANAAH